MDNETVLGPPPCVLSEAVLNVVYGLQFASGFVVTPIVSFVGVPFYAFILVALAKETSNEGAYIYQALLTFGKAMETLTSVLLNYSFYGGGLGNEGLVWYRKSYFLVFYTAHISSFILQFFQFFSLFLATFMSIDRLWALLWPMSYQQHNKRLQAIIAVVVSTLISALCSIYMAWLFKVEVSEDDGLYKAVDNFDFEFGYTMVFMSTLTIAFRIVGVAILVICSLLLVYYFRVRFVKAQPLLAAGSKDKEQRRKNKERPLFLLTFWQAMFCFLGNAEQIVFTSLISYYAYFQCYSGIIGSYDSIFMLLINFFEPIVPFVFNKNLRSMVGRMFRRRQLTISIRTAMTSQSQQVLR